MLSDIINEEINDFLKDQTFREKKKALFNSQPVIVYRGLSKTGKNFYKGSTPLPYAYYTLLKNKALRYGEVNNYLFNAQSLPVKILRGSKLFDIFGLHSDVENPKIIDALKQKGYQGVLIGDELIIYDLSLISSL